MIKVKGKVVTFTGKDAKQLQDLADSLGKTPQETLEQAIREHMQQLDYVTPIKKTTKRSK